MAEGTEVGTAYVSILPSTSGFGNALNTSVSGAAGQAADKIEGTIGGSFKKLAGIAAGAFAGKEIFGFLEGAVDQARESNKVAAQTEAVIKSTGGAAKLTAAQFADLATSISNKTGIDDEQVQSAENLLATFTNIRNEVGKNNDVFSQATKIAVDMGAALGGDASSNAIQLGKALNDPVKGITALTRVGVTFTDQQKDQIKTLVASGKTLDAQKIILGELNREFGGSAAAQATAADRFKVTWGNLQEQLGNALIPIIDKTATFLAEKLPGAFNFVSRAAAAVRPTIEGIVRVVTSVANAFKFLFEDGEPQGFAEILDNLLGNSGQYIGFFQGLGDIILQVSGFISDNLKPILIGLGATILFLASPVAAAVAALILLYTRFQTVRDVVAAVADFLINTVAPAVAQFIGYLSTQFANFVAYVQTIWPQVSEAITHVLNVVEGIIRTTIDVVSALWRQWGDDLLRIAATVWGLIRATIENALQVIRGVIQTVVALINGDWGKAWDGLKGIVAGIFGQIGAVITGAIGVIRGLLGGIASTVLDVAKTMWNPLLDFLKGVLRGIVEAWNSLDLKVPKVHIPGTNVDFGGFDLIPDFPIPFRDAGGPVFAGHPYMIGRGPELFMPSVSGGIASTPDLTKIADIIGGGKATGPVLGELNLYGAAMSPADITTELAWYAKTSGR